MTNNTAVINGVTMRWQEQGVGTPIVFIHGIPTSPLLWRYVLPQITDARCLAFEMVGYGESIPEGRHRDISMAAQADYLAMWLEYLDVEKAMFVGHDLGGGVAHIAAVRYPKLCAGLFLTNAIGYDSWPIPSVKAMQAIAPAAKHFPKAMGKQIVRTLMYRGHDDHAKAKEAADLHWAPYDKEEGTEALVRQMQHLHVEDTLAVADELPRLNVPARILWGAADRFQKIKYGERFARDLNAPLRCIENGKHFTPEDHPDEIAQEINSLIGAIH